MCLYVPYQKALDNVYEALHPGQKRINHPGAVVMPHIDFASQSIKWDQSYRNEEVTTCVKRMIAMGNKLIPPEHHKDPEEYSSHSCKRGGTEEALRRGLNMHEAQSFTGHKEPRNVCLYGMQFGEFQNAEVLKEMQQPPLRSTHSIRTTRMLQMHILDAIDVIQALRETLDENHDRLIKVPTL